MALLPTDSIVSFFILLPFLAFLLFMPDAYARRPVVGLSETQAIVERKLQKVDQDELSKFDDFARQLMAKANAPGVQLAVAKGGDLKYFKGFGLANIDTKEPVTTESVMRYYSVSKTITGTAILQLVQEGRLRLDDKPFLLLEDVVPPKNAKVDPRLFNITVQNLLQHTGGWNRTLTQFDPGFMPNTLLVSQSLGTPAPATAYDQIRLMKSIPLDFDPGTAFEYSNIGYNVLGRVIEKVTGMKYRDYIQEHLFHLTGVKGMSIAHSRVEDLEPNEVRYYGIQGKDELTVSVFPGEGYVPRSYGVGDYGHMDSWGGWVGSAGDVVRFMVHADGLRKPAILGPEMVYAMLNTPRPTANGSMVGDDFRGLQWFVGEVENGKATLLVQNGGVPVGVDEKGKVTFYFHDGAAPGAHSLCIRLVKEEVSMAFLMNTLPNISHFDPEAVVNFTSLVASIKEWPLHDLFAD